MLPPNFVTVSDRNEIVVVVQTTFALIAVAAGINHFFVYVVALIFILVRTVSVLTSSEIAFCLYNWWFHRPLPQGGGLERARTGRRPESTGC
jgi:hypothetical protein